MTILKRTLTRFQKAVTGSGGTRRPGLGRLLTDQFRGISPRRRTLVPNAFGVTRAALRVADYCKRGLEAALL